MTPLLRAEGLSRVFDVGAGLFSKAKRHVRAVDGVTLEVAKGTTLGLVGESGCGKSTVGRLLLGLLPPSEGRVFLGDTQVTGCTPETWQALRRRMQMIFQDPYGALNPRLKVEEIVAEPLEIHQPQLSAAERREKVLGLLSAVGIRPEQASRFPSEFSGGQRQRIVIARALAVEPELIVADEPVSALDVSIQAQIVNLMMDLQRERGLTFVFISHDLRVVEHVADEVAVMYLGRLVERAPTEALFDEPLHPYTGALLSAVPDPRPGKRRERILLEGDVPSPMSPPSGCTFHPRCPKLKTLDAAQQARCREEKPLLRVLGQGRSCACHHV